MVSKLLNLTMFHDALLTPLLGQMPNGTAPQPLSLSNPVIAVSVLIFGVVILLMQGWLFIRKNQGLGTQYIRLFGLTLVVISAVFLVSTGFPQDQVSPAFTLLGTIAGYLLKSGEAKE
jgi:hypothetical protein